MAELAVRDLVVRYGSVTAVNGISFRVAEGEFVSLLGPSGCGKTTTLRCVAGLETASGGEIRIGGDVVAARDREVPPERRDVNMVFQSYAVWPHMTVFDNVAYGLRVRGMDRAEIARRTEEALRLVGLSGLEARFGTELSGGQQQRVAVARAVVTEPRLLLFDEPLSNLDAGLRERMRMELVQLQRRLRRTSLYVTHDQAEAMAMSDRIILMNRGRIVQESTPRELYERPRSRFAAEFLGNPNLIAADGPLALRPREGAAPPGSLLCIRPEHVVPVREVTGENVFTARVLRLSYVGTALHCELDAAGTILRADLPARSQVTAGEMLQFHVDPDCVVPVPAQDPS